MQFPIVDAELVDEPAAEKKRGAPSQPARPAESAPWRGPTSAAGEVPRTPFSSPYAARRMQQENARKSEAAPEPAPEPKRTPEPKPQSQPQQQSAAEPADESISVQDLIKREGGHARPRRRRALWDPRDYDETDGAD
jgi:RND superfamily putative drug exporter